jgi:uncharacterized protein involved in exopolysaccharide biosynthesis
MQQPKANDAPAGRSSSTDGYLDFRESLSIVWGARWLVLGAVAAFGLAGFSLGSVRPQVFESTVRLREQLPADSSEAPVSKDSTALLRGRALAEAAAAGSGLSPEAIAASVTVEEPEPRSSSVTLRVHASDPARAVDVAQRLAEAAVALSLKASEERASRAMRLLESREATARERVAAARARLAAFLREIPASRPEARRETAVAGSHARLVSNPERYSERDAELARLTLEIQIAESAYRDTAVRGQRAMERLRSELWVVDEPSRPGAPVPRGRARKALLGAGLGAVLALVGVFALLIARSPGPSAGPPL